MVCPHEAWQRDTASEADGLCPLCLKGMLDLATRRLAGSEAARDGLINVIERLKDQIKDIQNQADDEIGRLTAAQEWRDISTAPKNETDVLLGRHGFIPAVGYIGPHRKEWWMPGTGSNVPFEPTHWMPTPKPPVAVIAEERGTK